MAFFGYTGAGKSTQIRSLASKLKTRGAKVRSTHIKNYHPLTSFLLKYYSKKDYNEGFFEEHYKSLISLDLIVNIFFMLAANILKVHLFLHLKYTVLVEEYLFGTITDYIHAYRTLRLNFKLVTALSNLLLRFIPKKTIAVILVADNENLEDRWTKRDSVFEHPEYLKTQQVLIKFYEKSMGNLIYINSNNRNIAEVTSEILSKLC